MFIFCDRVGWFGMGTRGTGNPNSSFPLPTVPSNHQAVSSKQLKKTHVDTFMVANVRLLDQRGSTPQAIGSTTPPGGCHLWSFLLPSPPSLPGLPAGWSDAKRTDKAHKFCPSRHAWGTELPLTSLPSEDFTAPKWATSFDVVEALKGRPLWLPRCSSGIISKNVTTSTVSMQPDTSALNRGPPSSLGCRRRS